MELRLIKTGVPCEPTREMTDALVRNEAYCDSCKGTSFDSVNGYDDMLAASPFAKKGG